MSKLGERNRESRTVQIVVSDTDWQALRLAALAQGITLEVLLGRLVKEHVIIYQGAIRSLRGASDV